MHLMWNKTVNHSSHSSGIGIFGLLGILFVTLKLLEVINWSWWWVTVPFWGPITLVFVVVVVGILIILAPVLWQIGKEAAFRINSKLNLW